MLDSGEPVQIIDVVRVLHFPQRTSWMVRSGAIPSAFVTGSGNCRNQTRSSCSALRISRGMQDGKIALREAGFDAKYMKGGPLGVESDRRPAKAVHGSPNQK